METTNLSNLSRSEIYAGNLITPVNGASIGSFSGTNMGEPIIRPSSCTTPRQPTIYISGLTTNNSNK